MTYPILSWALPIALSMLVLAMVLALVRLLKGPSAQDRVLALDCMYLNGMLLALVLGIHYGSTWAAGASCTAPSFTSRCRGKAWRYTPC
ncbi:MAG: hypothetical protein B7X79_06045 [Acidovorax sp. 17-64-282]|nr:MAG: hypothetical protein B7X79_06045 [Acidovorax sp. 17-64-282]